MLLLWIIHPSLRQHRQEEEKVIHAHAVQCKGASLAIAPLPFLLVFFAQSNKRVVAVAVVLCSAVAVYLR